MAGFWPASSTTRLTRPITAIPPVRRSCLTSLAGGWTISSRAGARAEPSPASARCCGWRDPDVHIIACEPEAAALLAGKPFSPAQDPGLDARLCTRSAQSRRSRSHWSRSATPKPSRPRVRWPPRKAFSAASPPARTVRGSAEHCARSPPGRGHTGDAAGYGRALSLHRAVRRNQ